MEGRPVWPPSAVAIGNRPGYPPQGPCWSDGRATTGVPSYSRPPPSSQLSGNRYQSSQVMPGGGVYGQPGDVYDLPGGGMYGQPGAGMYGQRGGGMYGQSQYGGSQRFFGSPLPMSPFPVPSDTSQEPEFSAEALLVARPTGVPEVLFAGRKPAERERVHDVEESRLERQLELEASMEGVEQPFATKQVQPQVDNQHPSKMPGWSRREWLDDPFYGWRTQNASKVPKVPTLVRAEEAARKAALDKRLSQIHGDEPMPVAPEPAVASVGPEMLLRHSPAPSMRPLPPSAALLLEDQPPKPSWHDAVIKERIVAASYSKGSLTRQDEALKQAAVTDFRLPVNAAVDGYLEPEANPARLVDMPDNVTWSERAPKAADKDAATGKPPSMLWFLGL